MRRETLLGVGFLLAAVAEIQWATAFYLRASPSPVEAALTFAAGAGLLLVAFGCFILERAAWPRILGLSMAALAHVAYFGVTIPAASAEPPVSYALGAASLLAAIGLSLAAVASVGERKPQQIRVGIAGAALAGLIWIVYSVLSANYEFLVGNVFAAIGFGMAALYADA